MAAPTEAFSEGRDDACGNVGKEILTPGEFLSGDGAKHAWNPDSAPDRAVEPLLIAYRYRVWNMPLAIAAIAPSALPSWIQRTEPMTIIRMGIRFP